MARVALHLSVAAYNVCMYAHVSIDYCTAYVSPFHWLYSFAHHLFVSFSHHFVVQCSVIVLFPIEMSLN